MGGWVGGSSAPPPPPWLTVLDPQTSCHVPPPGLSLREKQKGARNPNRNECSRGRSQLHGQHMGKTQNRRSIIEQWLAAVGGGWRLVVGGDWWSLVHRGRATAHKSPVQCCPRRALSKSPPHAPGDTAAEGGHTIAPSAASVPLRGPPGRSTSAARASSLGRGAPPRWSRPAATAGEGAGGVRGGGAPTAVSRSNTSLPPGKLRLQQQQIQTAIWRIQ